VDLGKRFPKNLFPGDFIGTLLLYAPATAETKTATMTKEYP
jgi:hypothetical protein